MLPREGSGGWAASSELMGSRAHGGERIRGSASAKSSCVLRTGKDNSWMGYSLEKEGKTFSMQH